MDILNVIYGIQNYTGFQKVVQLILWNSLQYTIDIFQY